MSPMEQTFFWSIKWYRLKFPLVITLIKIYFKITQFKLKPIKKEKNHDFAVDSFKLWPDPHTQIYFVNLQKH